VHNAAATQPISYTGKYTASRVIIIIIIIKSYDLLAIYKCVHYCYCCCCYCCLLGLLLLLLHRCECGRSEGFRSGVRVGSEGNTVESTVYEVREYRTRKFPKFNIEIRALWHAEYIANSSRSITVRTEHRL